MPFFLFSIGIQVFWTQTNFDILQEIENVAQDLDLTVELRHKKINISNSRVYSSCFLFLPFLNLEIILYIEMLLFVDYIAWVVA